MAKEKSMKSSPQKDYVAEKCSVALAANIIHIRETAAELAGLFEGDPNQPIDVQEIDQKLEALKRDVDSTIAISGTLKMRLKKLATKK